MLLERGADVLGEDVAFDVGVADDGDAHVACGGLRQCRAQAAQAVAVEGVVLNQHHVARTRSFEGFIDAVERNGGGIGGAGHVYAVGGNAVGHRCRFLSELGQLGVKFFVSLV